LLDTLPSPDDNTPEVIDYNAGWDTFVNRKPQFYEVLSGQDAFRSSTGLDFTNSTVLSSEGFGVNGRKLRVKFESLVDKILFKDGNGVAVKYTLNGETKYVYARKQIILTAFTVNSPAILQRSGYGPADLIEQHKIDLVYNNTEVGKNLQNHVGSIFIVASNLTQSSGFLTEQAYLSILPEVNGRRLVQVLLSPLLSGTSNAALDTCLGLFSLPDETWHAYAFFLSVMSPASRGTVEITSREPAVQPTINSGFYSDATNRDLRAMIGTFKVLHNNVEALKSVDPFSFKQLYPPASADFDNDEELGNYIKSLPFIHQHWSGTCAMGTVVDPNLSLKGVNGVTVADISVAPSINDGNTASSAMFIAQQASNILINKFKNT